MEVEHGIARDRPRTVLPIAAVLVAVSLLAWLTYRSLFDLPFVGWDTYPTILSSRILSPGDLADTFSEELMEGRYTDGHFYRPVANLVFALDYALFGVEPLGYHLTDLAILIANATLLAAVTRKLFRSTFAGMVAALVFVVHPIQLEVFPVPPRRGDTLCLMFSLAVLIVQVRPGEHASALRRRLGWALTALFAFCAVSSKETGAFVFPLLFGLHSLWALGGGVAGAVRHALARCVPAIVAAAVYGTLRIAAIGGIGGHRESSLAHVATLPSMIRPYLELVLYPQPLLENEGLARGLVVGAAIALAALAIHLWRGRDVAAEGERATTRSGLPFLAFWVACLLGISSVSGRLHVWYAMLFAAPYSILLGLLVERGIRYLRARRFALGLPTVALPLLLAATHLRFSSLVYTYREWEIASRGTNDFLDRFRTEVESARPGEVLVLDRMPQRLGFRDAVPTPHIQSTWILAHYSVEAYGELMLPEHPVTVKMYEGEELSRFLGGDLVHVYIYNGTLDRDLFR